MKKILLFCIFMLSTFFCFADEPGDEYDDGYVYETNGVGDQYLKMGIMPFIPLNFKINSEDKVYVGGAVELGYYRFLTGWLAVGGEVTPTFNPTVGANLLTTVPITFGVVFQPTVWKLEFPITINAGIAYETIQNSNYFPGFVLKGEVGAYYRFSDTWSFGLCVNYLWLPEWWVTYEDAEKKIPKDKGFDDGHFLGVAVTARYHF